MGAGRTACLLLAATLAAGAAPMQCPTTDREPLPTYPDAAEECYLLAGRLRERGDLEGWRAALEYVVERFPGTRWAARADDDLRHGPPTSGTGGATGPNP
ncbi:MAG: hypothetical protein JXB32_02870 [Deltaproteobacteria bacterium]|nr:hypothetical protein [Deltaproteobacteria bacterium]